MMSLAIGPQRRTKIVCRQRLADRADIVPLSFHREQPSASDGVWLDSPVLIGQRTDRQGVLLKDQLNRLEIKLGGQIKHREILVIKCLGLSSLCGVAIRQILIKVPVRLYLAAKC